MSKPSCQPIKDFALGIYDGPHATPAEVDDGPVFLGIRNVTPEGRLDLTEVRHISEQEFPKWTRRVEPQKDDIVFSYEATLHRYALIPDNLRCCLGRRMALVRPDPQKVVPRFLHYYFLSSIWRSVVEANVISGATVDRIPIAKFPDFEVQLPPLENQKRIANILSTYDDLIENNRRRIQLLEESARLLYREWFVHLRFPGHEHVKVVDGVPEGWEKKTTFDITDILSGGTPKTDIPDFWNGEIPFFTPKDSTGELYVYETEKKISEAGLKCCNSKLYPKNTIFITARGTVGKLCLTQREMAMNQTCYALLAKPPLNQYFLYFSLKENIDHFKSQATGSVFDAIVRDTFKLIPFVIPDKRIIVSFTDSIASAISQIDNLIAQQRQLKKARDLLLPRLMNGEITV